MRFWILGRLPAGIIAAATCIVGIVCGDILAPRHPDAWFIGVAAALLALPALVGRLPRLIQIPLLLAAFVALGFARGADERARVETEMAALARFDGETWVSGRLMPGDIESGEPGVLRIREARLISQREMTRFATPVAVAVLGENGRGSIASGVTADASRAPHRAVDGTPLLPRSPVPDTPRAPRGIYVAGFVDLCPPRGPRHPGGWDDRLWLRGKGLAGWCTPRSLAVVAANADSSAGGPSPITEATRALFDPPAHAWSRAMRRARSGCAGYIRDRLGSDEGEFAATFLLGAGAAGERGGKVEVLLQRAGLGHLLAVSGYHVALIAGAFYLLLMMAPLHPRVRWLVLAALLLAYAGLVGWSASVGRAASAGAAWAVMRAAGRKAEAIPLLVFAAVIALWLEPWSWRLPGFQLSYLITFAILASVRENREKRQGIAGRMRQFVAVLAAAQLAAWPLTLAHFGSASLIFPLANAVLVPYSGFLMPILIAGLALGVLPGGVGEIAAIAPRALVHVMLQAADWAACLGDPMYAAAALPMAAGVAGALLVAILFSLRGVRLAVRIAAATLVIAAITLAGMSAVPLPRFLMLDVGQGESWLLLWPHETWLFDLGPPPGSADRPSFVLPTTLRYTGRARIDRLFLSHGDADHVGGWREIARAGVTIEHVHHPPEWEPPESLQRWLDSLAARGTEVSAAVRGDRFAAGGGEALVLHPPREGSGSDNAQSLALAITARNTRLLLCGDVPGDEQRKWVRDGLAPQAEMLTAAHHGSRDSTPFELLCACRPRIVAASAGRGNRYGHPSGELVARVGVGNAALLRTDRHGTVTFLVGR